MALLKTRKHLDFKESTRPCYPKGIAYETEGYSVVFYEVSTQGGMTTWRKHWRAYTMPDGHYVDGDKEYRTRKQAEDACEARERVLRKRVKTVGKG